MASDVSVAKEQNFESKSRLVAVKVCKDWVLERNDRVDRLVRESTGMKDANHPSIIKVDPISSSQSTIRA